MAVSAVSRLVHLRAPYPSEPWYPPSYTGGTPVPVSKSPKGIGIWYKSAAGLSCERLGMRKNIGISAVSTDAYEAF
jgi:hypothetical protein